MRLDLSDGRAVTLRRLRDGDAEPLLAFYAGLSEQSDWFFAPFRAPEYTLDTMADLVATQRDDHSWDFVLENECGELVAHCFLWELAAEVPMLGIGIADAYQDRGLGHVLMQHLIDHARTVLHRPGVRLDLNADNLRAYHLYRKVGFIETGRRVVDRADQGRFGHDRLVPMVDMVIRF